MGLSPELNPQAFGVDQVDGTDTGFFFNTTIEMMVLHLRGFVVPDLVNLNYEYTVMGGLKFRGIQDYRV